MGLVMRIPGKVCRNTKRRDRHLDKLPCLEASLLPIVHHLGAHVKEKIEVGC